MMPNLVVLCMVAITNNTTTCLSRNGGGRGGELSKPTPTKYLARPCFPHAWNSDSKSQAAMWPSTASVLKGSHAQLLCFVTQCGLLRKTGLSTKLSKTLLLAATVYKQSHFDTGYSQVIHRSFTVHSQFTHTSRNTADCPPCKGSGKKP